MGCRMLGAEEQRGELSYRRHRKPISYMVSTSPRRKRIKMCKRKAIHTLNIGSKASIEWAETPRPEKSPQRPKGPEARKRLNECSFDVKIKNARP